MAKRGFFAEMAHQSQLAAQQRQRAATASAKAQTAASREAERAQKAYERAQQQASRASASEQKAAEREALRLHQEAMQADAESRTAELVATLDEIDSMMAASLVVDDFVDLEELRVVAVHPPFDRGDLELPAPMPAPIVGPVEPGWVEPEGAKGLFGKKKHAEEVAQKRAIFEQQHQAWQAEAARVPGRQLEAMQQHQALEQQRVANLERERSRYGAECEQRERETAAGNQALDVLIGGLAQNREEAIQEYIGIVMSNSVYPASFPVEHEHTFDSLMRELTATVTVPPPSAVPAVKEYKYVRAKDEIVGTAATAKECKERYAHAVAQVALRTIHEVFESDRAGRIQTIAITVGTSTVNPATGLTGFVPFIAAAADRTSFMQFDLSQAVPAATLLHLGCSGVEEPVRSCPDRHLQGCARPMSGGDPAAFVFNTPPGWPVPEKGWSPPPGWKPDPSWPPAPTSWVFWAPASPPAAVPQPAPAPMLAPQPGPLAPARAEAPAPVSAAPQPSAPPPLAPLPPPPAVTAPSASADPAGRVAQLEAEVAVLRARLTDASAGSVDVVELNDERALQEVGIYRYHHPVENSEEYRDRLRDLQELVKTFVNDGNSILASDMFTFNGSLAKGRKMTADFSKLMLRAYNAEADNCVRTVRSGNVLTATKRLEAAVVSIQKLGSMMEMRINLAYHELRVQEIELTADYQMKVQHEREEAREERERLREERRAEAELAAERERLDKERSHYANALAAVAASGEPSEVAVLEAKLAELDAAIEQNDYRTANIRAGYVYVISNPGAFGPDVVKIGMTRRLEPLDRVRELGDASVPFPFSVHALFFSADAITLENDLHAAFADRKVNRVNERREFFFATPHEVREILALKVGNLLEFADQPEAVEFFQSRKYWPAAAQPAPS